MTIKRQPLLLTHGISKVVTLGSGGRTRKDNQYMYLVGDITGSNQREVKGIYAFSLPFKTELHLVGIPNKESGDSWMKGAKMERVILEGDYQSHFSLYAAEGQQALSRYHFDPQAMVFSIDFCANVHWEIVNNTLYFLDEDILPSLDIADEFIQLIKPAFHETIQISTKLFISQIGEDMKDSSLNLNCPVCKLELMQGKQWLVCPDGHGYLIKGIDMLNIRRDNTNLTKQLSEVLGRPPKVISKITNVEHDELICPHCDHPMQITNYQSTDIVLDVCSYCPYRWIDGSELDSVLGRYRHESY